MLTTHKDDSHTENPSNEGDPLLEEISRLRSARDSPSRDPSPNCFWMVVGVCVLMSLLELEESVQAVPTLQLYESAICQQHYNRSMPEDRCKTSEIQQKLAWVRAYQGVFDSLPTLLLSFPFGYLADKKGRRLVIFLSELGEICSLGWILMTCMLWKKIPILIVWLNSVFRILGGGRSVSFVIIQTIAADLSTSPLHRNRVLSIVACVSVGVSVFGPIIARAALQHSLWLPYCISITALVSSFPILYLMPETLPLATDTSEPKADLRQDIKSLFQWSAITSGGLLANPYQTRIFAGLACIFLGHFTAPTVGLIPQYASYKFGMEFSKTTTFQTIICVVYFIVLLGIITYERVWLNEIGGLRNDNLAMALARVGFAFLTLGALFISLAPSELIMRISLVIFAAGLWSRTALVSVLMGFSEPHHRAKFNSLIAMSEQMAGLIGKLMIQKVWESVIPWSGVMLGLPFMILTVSIPLQMAFFFIAFMLSVLLLDTNASEISPPLRS